jgi:hypothetical protein
VALREKLDARRATAKDRFTPEDRAVMQRATEDLRNSGLLNHALKAGDTAPDWTLPSPRGGPVRSSELLANGPLVLTFFRGVW